MPRLNQPDPDCLPIVVTRAEALAVGLSRDEVRWRLLTGRWHRLAAGTYLRGHLESTDPYERARSQHVLESLAVAGRIADGTVAFGSAALVHGAQLASGVPGHHELVVPPGRWNGIRSGTRVRIAKLEAADVMAVAGSRVTAPARTWVDVARSADAADAFSTGDSLLRAGHVTTGELALALERHEAQRGLRAVSGILHLLSPLRENALESKSFATFIAWGLPLPDCQVDVAGECGFIGRVDFLWREAGVIGEADGRLKYTDRTALYAEKRREDALRAEGFEVVRWGWRLDDGLRRRLARLLRA